MTIKEMIDKDLLKVGQKVRIVKWCNTDKVEYPQEDYDKHFPDRIGTVRNFDDRFVNVIDFFGKSQVFNSDYGDQIELLEENKTKLLGYTIAKATPPFITKEQFEKFRITEDELYLYINEINKPKQNIMTDIIEFAKNLTLSKEEKLLRKHGLKDENNNYTQEARVLVGEKQMKENEAYLIEIAEAKEAEDKTTK